MKYSSPRYLFRRYEIMRLVNKGETFLEIGPGNLDLAQELLTRFSRGVAIDFNTTDVEQIYKRLPESIRRRLNLVIADFSKYDQFNNKFDGVVACEVLEHIDDDLSFLKKTNELLNDKGQLIISVPARMKYWAIDDAIAGHYRRYEKEELSKELAEAGFTSITIISYGFPFENLVRLARIFLARLQYSKKANWSKRTQSQQSAFFVKRNPFVNLVGLILNKYTITPFSLLASMFNNLDLAEGYIASAIKAAG